MSPYIYIHIYICIYILLLRTKGKKVELCYCDGSAQPLKRLSTVLCWRDRARRQKDPGRQQERAKRTIVCKEPNRKAANEQSVRYLVPPPLLPPPPPKKKKNGSTLRQRDVIKDAMVVIRVSTRTSEYKKKKAPAPFFFCVYVCERNVMSPRADSTVLL